MPPLATSFPPPALRQLQTPGVATISAMAATCSISGKLPPPSLTVGVEPPLPPFSPTLPPLLSLPYSPSPSLPPSLPPSSEAQNHYSRGRVTPRDARLASSVVSVGPLHRGRAPARRPPAPLRHLPLLPPMPSRPSAQHKCYSLTGRSVGSRRRPRRPAEAGTKVAAWDPGEGRG